MHLTDLIQKNNQNKLGYADYMLYFHVLSGLIGMTGVVIRFLFGSTYTIIPIIVLLIAFILMFVGDRINVEKADEMTEYIKQRARRIAILAVFILFWIIMVISCVMLLMNIEIVVNITEYISDAVIAVLFFYQLAFGMSYVIIERR